MGVAVVGPFIGNTRRCTPESRRAGFEKNAVAVIGSDRRDMLPRIMIVLSATVPIATPCPCTDNCIVSFYTTRVPIMAVTRHHTDGNRINQSSSSAAKLRGLNCYNRCPRQHPANKAKAELYTDITACSIKLAVRFHPMQPKRMQESREALQHCRVALPVRSANARFSR